MRYNYIGQFVTILSVNKTRDFWMGAFAPIFCCVVFFLGTLINNVPCIGIDAKTKQLFWTADVISTTEPQAK